jgi:cytochrome bd-type quinol oxidase subunit 2
MNVVSCQSPVFSRQPGSSFRSKDLADDWRLATGDLSDITMDEEATCKVDTARKFSKICSSGCIQFTMSFGEHARITGGALKNWAVAQAQDSLAVGCLWLLGLYLLKVPWAPLWAILGAVLQIVPHIGPVLSLIGPVFAAWIHWGSLQHSLYVLMLYAGIVIVDGFLLQPYIMKRTARVPIWASILAPIVLGILIPFWGVLIAAPLLAVIYAYKEHQAKAAAKF